MANLISRLIVLMVSVPIHAITWVIWKLCHLPFQASISPKLGGDGDSFKVLKGNKEIHVRIKGYDAPEYTQQGGKESAQYVRNLLEEGKFKVIPVGRGHYNRLIVKIRLEDGRDLRKTLIQAGMGWDTSRAIFKMHRKARKQKTGIWAYRQNSTPKQYRHAH